MEDRGEYSGESLVARPAAPQHQLWRPGLPERGGSLAGWCPPAGCSILPPRGHRNPCYCPLPPREGRGAGGS